jgi:transposase-like protein
MAQRADVSKQARWLGLMRRWQRSRTTIRAFCQRHQVSEAGFFSWRRVLRERGLLEEATPSRASADVPAFVKVTMLEDEASVSAVELVVDQRRVLRVRPGFDADMLLQLVRLLEEPAC